MEGWEDGGMDGWLGEWRHGRVDGLGGRTGWVDTWMSGSIDR